MYHVLHMYIVVN